MDGQRFDGLVRSFARRSSRRSMLRGAAAVAAAGVFARQGHFAAAQGNCDAGFTDCGGTCVDLLSDEANCGACGEICESDLVGVACIEGECVRTSCPAALPLQCGETVDDCVDPATDSNNCGGCGIVCESGLVGVACIDGECVRTSCPAALPLQCGETVEDCVDPATDPNNCGGCGIVCGDGLTCFEGVCDCPSGDCGAPDPDPEPQPSPAPIVQLPNTGSGGSSAGSDGSGLTTAALIAAAAAGAAALRRWIPGTHRS